MSEQELLVKAAREARKAAERARHFADIFEEYADCLLTEPNAERAAGLRLHGKNKFAEMREALSDSEDWARLAERRSDASVVHVTV